MNIRNHNVFKRLVNDVNASYKKLGPFREKRSRLLKAFVGSDYSDMGEVHTVYLYLLTMAANIYVRQLAVRAPTADITSPYPELRSMAKNLSISCKDVAKETDFGRQLRRCAMDALFSPKSVLKIGLEYLGTDKYEDTDTDVDVTVPFVQKVSFDDYVCDMSARSAGSPAFEGDRYYMGREEFERKYPGQWKKLGLTRDDLGTQNEDGTTRAEALSHDPKTGTHDGFKQKIALQDVWLHDERKLVTWVVNKAVRPLDVIDFDTMEDGPYHSLWFTDVPDNAMPFPPFAALHNIHQLANSMFRRLALQARKQKALVAFGDEEEAKRFKAASDGDAIWWGGQKPEALKVGGLDQATAGWFLQVKDIFSWTAGNLDAMGGLSPQADTLGQEELISSSSSAQMADMQDAMTDFTRGVFRQLAWYEWTDPVRSRVLQKKIPGIKDYVAVEWSPKTRQGDFLDFNFDINPHSMREDNPSSKLNRLVGVVRDVFMPMGDLMQQQGKTVDIDRLKELAADYANLPEIEQLIVMLDPAMQQPGPGPVGNPTPKPANTTRRYIRENRPGATRSGKDMALSQTLFGAGIQPAESAAAGRAVG